MFNSLCRAVLLGKDSEVPRPEEMLSVSSDLDAVLAALPKPVVVLDREYRIARINAAAEEQYGHVTDEVLGRSIWDFCGPGDQQFERAVVERVMAGEVFGPSVRERVRDDGIRLWVSVTAVPIRDSEDRIIGSCWLSRDITRKRMDQQVLAEQVDRFNTAFEASPIGMAVATFKGRLTMVNPAMCRMLGFTSKELLAIEAPSLHDPEDAVATQASVEALREGQESTQPRRKRLRRKDGHDLWVEETLAVLERDPDSPFQVLVQCRDVSANVEQEQRNQYLMDHDHLTGLLNRRAVERVVRQHYEAVTERCEASDDGVRNGRAGFGALLVVDLDGFKRYNDTYGHAMGDQTLAAATRPLAEGLRDGDVAGRTGGDEFVVLLRDSDGRGAELVAERLVQAIAEAAPSPGAEHRVAASIGIADFDPARSLQQTFVEADRAMYRAKRQGGNRWSR